MDSVNSTTFIKRPPCMTDIQEKFLYTKELLSGRIFLGRYVEKRYVSVLREYRDVVFLNSEEIDLQHDVDKIRRKWLGVKDLKWVGVTGPDEFGCPEAYCLWVKLTNLAIGQYWFQIKHVKLVENEIVFQLKCIRKSQAPLVAVTPEISEKHSDEVKPVKAGSASGSLHPSPTNTFLSEPTKKNSALQEAYVDAIQTVRPFCTLRNFTTVVRVGCALSIAFIFGIISLVGHVGEYILALIREFTLLVNAFTPIVVQLIDFLSKVIGGLFILLAGMFRNGNTPVNVRPSRNQLFYNAPIVPTVPSLSSLPHRGGGQMNWRERNRALRQELYSEVYKRQ